MSKEIMAFVLVAIVTVALVVLLALEIIAWEVGGPLLALIVGASIGYLFPNTVLK